MKKLYALLLAVLLTVAGCSAIFTSSITGSVVDGENADTTLGNCVIALYDSEGERSNDEALFYTSSQEDPTDDFSGYIQKTVTADDGTYRFNNLMWEATSPEYGKDGDVRDFFFLIYRKDYGLTRTEARIISGGTNRIENFKLFRNLNRTTIRGRIVQTTNRDQGLGGTVVSARIPASWGYAAADTDGTLFENVVWSDHSDTLFSTNTDDYGYFTLTVSYRKMPDSVSNKGTVPARLEWSRNGCSLWWRYSNDDDTAITTGQEKLATGLDDDGDPSTAVVDWTLSDPVLTAPSTFTDTDLDGILDVWFPLVLRDGQTINREASSDWMGLKPTRFSTSLEGRISSGGTYVNGTEVWLFIADDNGSNTVSDGRYPDFTAVTQSVQVNNSGTNDYESGHYTFNGIEWEDSHYSGLRSLRGCQIRIPDADDRAAGYVSGGADHQQSYNLKGDGGNSAEISY